MHWQAIAFSPCYSLAGGDSGCWYIMSSQRILHKVSGVCAKCKKLTRAGVPSEVGFAGSEACSSATVGPQEQSRVPDPWDWGHCTPYRLLGAILLLPVSPQWTDIKELTVISQSDCNVHSGSIQKVHMRKNRTCVNSAGFGRILGDRDPKFMDDVLCVRLNPKLFIYSPAIPDQGSSF